MNVNLQPILESDLLIIRPLRASDFDNLYQVASDPLIWEQHQNKNRYTLNEFTKFFNEALTSKGALILIDKMTREVVGTSRFRIIDQVEEVIEIGWSFLAREFWGGKYNREMKKLMINHALKSFKIIVFYVSAHNFRSQCALQKLGAIEMFDSTQLWVLSRDKGITFSIDKPLK